MIFFFKNLAYHTLIQLGTQENKVIDLRPVQITDSRRGIETSDNRMFIKSLDYASCVKMYMVLKVYSDNSKQL